MKFVAALGVLLLLPGTLVAQDPCRAFRNVTITTCQSMIYDTWLTYTAMWRSESNSNLCNSGEEDFIEAWANDTWVTFGDGTYRDPRTGRVTRIVGFHERSSHRSGVTRFLHVNDQMITAVHEALHHRYPAWSETRVKRRLKRLTDYLCIPPGHAITF